MRRATSLLVLALVLPGCGGRLWTKPDPPLVTPCLEQPTAHVPGEPAGPAPGEPITDSYVVALQAWANSLLGTITADRIAWRGERRCIRRIGEAGHIQ